MLRFVLPLALAALPAAVHAADDNGEVRAAAHAFDQAQEHGDRAGLEAMIAPDFLFVRGSGRIGSKSDFIAGFTQPGTHYEPFVIRDPLLLRIAPDAAVVGGEGWIKGVENGRPFAEHFRYSDMFARRNGRWVVVYTQVTGLPAGSKARIHRVHTSQLAHGHIRQATTGAPW